MSEDEIHAVDARAGSNPCNGTEGASRELSVSDLPHLQRHQRRSCRIPPAAWMESAISGSSGPVPWACGALWKSAVPLAEVRFCVPRNALVSLHRCRALPGHRSETLPAGTHARPVSARRHAPLIGRVRLIVELVIGVCLLLGTVFGRIGVPDDKLATILSTNVRSQQKLHSPSVDSTGQCVAVNPN